MKNILLMGGNGYIGKEMIKQWLEKDEEVNFFVISRNGEDNFKNDRVKILKCDVNNVNELKKMLPEKIDYIVDLFGSVENDEKEMRSKNLEPAKIMASLAKEYNVKAQGFVAGKLGPKIFVKVKSEIADYLKNTGIRTEIVNPTLVYGAGRSDKFTKFVPILKIAGMFNKNLKPVRVEDVAKELIERLTKN